MKMEKEKLLIFPFDKNGIPVIKQYGYPIRSCRVKGGAKAQAKRVLANN